MPLPTDVYAPASPGDVAHAFAVVIDDGVAGEDVVGALGHFQSAALVTGAPAPYVRLQHLTRTDQASIMKAALLPDRGVVKVAGDDARKFLNGLITSRHRQDDAGAAAALPRC